MRAELPSGAFTSPVGFSITRTDPATLPPEGGVDPVVAYEFDFAVPTLNSPATLTFQVSLDGLDATTRADLLAALDAGRATLATRGDAAGGTYRTFPLCTGGATPSADGCVAVTKLDSVVRFSGVVGHFSTWAVAIAEPSPLEPLHPVEPLRPLAHPLDHLPSLERLQVRQGEAEQAQANRVAGRQGPRAGIALAQGQGNQDAAQGRACRRHGEAGGQTEGQGKEKAREDRQADRQGGSHLPAQRRRPGDEDEEDHAEAIPAALSGPPTTTRGAPEGASRLRLPSQ